MSKKLIVAALVAMLAFGATAMATGSRVETLGGQGLYLIDDTNIFSNPATVAYYQNCMLLHMGGADGGDMYAFGGMSMAIGDSLTLAGIAARNPMYEEGDISRVTSHAITQASLSLDLDGDTVIDIVTVPPTFNPVWNLDGLGDADAPLNQVVDWENPAEIIAAYKVGDLALGASYYLANGKLVSEDDLAETTYTATARLHSLKLGLSYKMDNMQPEAWFHWDPYSVKTELEIDPIDVTYEETLKGSKIVLGGRLFYTLNDNMTVVPAINYSRTTGSVTIDSDPDIAISASGDEEDLGQDYTINTLEAGVSLQYKADKVFVVTSAGLLWSKALVEYSIDDASDYTDDLTTKDFAIPVVAMGIEYQATQMLTLRAGMKTTELWAATTLLEEEEDTTGDLTDTSDLATGQVTTAAIGMALTFGNLVVDATFGDWVLVNEKGGGPNLFSAIDIKYKF
jgi:hypothetical protein